ncbi:MAG TPA: hypothetical protein VN814_18210 [Caulobacteraceae bacterium]|nr:hypothetical protein [Caulobacteraceae bacterium]
MTYDYRVATLARVPTPHQALATHLRGASAEVVGQFAPQLGWANNQAAVLFRGEGVLDAPGLVVDVTSESLTPTLRPADDALPQSGGIYVHRWFEVDADAADAFVELSGQGWKRFEAQFAAQIFGLFRAAPSPADAAAGVQRLLLITRYADHGVWEASRDPTSEAMQIFARRQQLTRRTWAASTLLVRSAQQEIQR